MVVASSVAAVTLLDAARAADPLVTQVELLDVYRSEQLGDDRKSVTISVRLQSLDRTLTEDDIKGARNALIGALESIGARLRT